MNKYLKILALSTSILSLGTPIAIHKNGVKNNLKAYESINNHEMGNKKSIIKYHINVNPNDSDVKFVSTTDEGEQELTNEEVIDYLDANLNEVYNEYDQLKTSLSNAIKDAMDYLDKCKDADCESELTNEQKLYIKERSNTIKYLAETLENLSEDVICSIDGCENYNDEEFNDAVNGYISAINNLEEHINFLQSSINSLYGFYPLNSNIHPNQFYGFRYNIYPNVQDPSQNIQEYNLKFQDDNNLTTNQNDDNFKDDDNIMPPDIYPYEYKDININDEVSEINNTESTNNQSADTEDATNKNTSNNTNNEENSTNNLETNQSEQNIEDDKPTTFGLKSNIDTYGPTKRNIDTFFNTALLDNGYYGNGAMYGYGYGMPYNNAYGGYGNGYGYYGGNMYGGMNAYQFNSNMINRENLEREVNAPIEVENEKNTEENNDVIKNNTPKNNNTPNKIKRNRAKNIDTYNQTTIQSNVNTMGESKISRFFKDKFNNIREKVKNRKQKNTQQELNKDYQDLEQENSTTTQNDENLINNQDNLINPNFDNSTNMIDKTNDALQDANDLDNAIKDINNNINPKDLDDVKIKKEQQPDAR